MPEMRFHSIFGMTDGGRLEGRLMLADGDLLAVLVRVSAEDLAGDMREPDGWFLEAGFGPCSSLYAVRPPVFDSLAARKPGPPANWVGLGSPGDCDRRLRAGSR